MKTRLVPLLAALVTLLQSAAADNAESSSSYYYGLYGGGSQQASPDAATVLQDVYNGKYSKLYVAYHNCAWSPYGGGNDGDNGECGGDGGNDEEYWYMGATACFRANAAYSLYGVVSGEDDVGCTRATFLNSYFTTSGVEAFTQSVYAAGVGFSSSSNNNDDEDNGYPGGVSSSCSYEDDGGGNNGDDAYEHNSMYNSGATSYGLGCNSDRTFAEMSFKGPYCSADDQIKVTDRLNRFNSDLSQVTCLPIYGMSSDGNEDGDGGEDGDALGLLSYSVACRVREFPKGCPDPHGILGGRASQEDRAVAKAAHPRTEYLKMIFSWVLLGLGVVLLLAALGVYYRRTRIGKERRKMWDRQRKEKKRPMLLGGGNIGNSNPESGRSSGTNANGKPSSGRSNRSGSNKRSMRSLSPARSQRSARSGQQNAKPSSSSSQPKRSWRKLFTRNNN